MSQVFSLEFKDQVLKEVEEVGNISLVCRKHSLKPSTVHGWLNKVRNKDKILEEKQIRELQRTIRDQEHEIIVLRALLKKTYPLWNSEKKLS
jgi:transposase